MSHDRREPSPFLTARWTNLVVANFEVPRELLEARVPAGTTLDAFAGKTFLSLVAFKFEDTRLFGAVPTPPASTFEELNLRFYVRRGDRRAVCFVREIVPSRFVAWVARTLYEEPYEPHPMVSSVEPHDAGDPARGGRFVYGWGSLLGKHHIAATTKGELTPLRDGSLEQFILEHYWGYTQRSDGTTSEYEVKHPPWKYWEVGAFEMDPLVGAFYGEPFVTSLTSPHSVFVAQGSAVSVFSGHTLPSPPAAPAASH